MPIRDETVVNYIRRKRAALEAQERLRDAAIAYSAADAAASIDEAAEVLRAAKAYAEALARANEA